MMARTRAASPASAPIRPGPPGPWRSGTGWALPALAALFTQGCELTEITVAQPEDVIIAEVQVVLTLDADGAGDVSMSALALLHRTFQAGGSRKVRGATVRVTGQSGQVVRLVEQETASTCLIPRDEELTIKGGVLEPFDDASCYRADQAGSPFSPGEPLSMEVVVPDGRVLTGASRTPGAFSFIGLTREDGQCRVEPDTHYGFEWTPSEGTWAYIADSRIEGLAEALAGQDIEAPDSLYLSALAIGREDTEIVFPHDFGLFDFFDDDIQDVIRALEDGLPGDTRAAVSLSAVDRNLTNWARGGNFNPSGLVRIPSVLGDGTGVFGTGVQRIVSIVSAPGGDGVPPLCGPPAAT
ncbi:MAG: hypothetical protein OXE96_04950 [Gemmatimonadetes bacterium]|nr:hypothetical protein [Gemmatimonadota bacterium]